VVEEAEVGIYGAEVVLAPLDHPLVDVHADVAFRARFLLEELASQATQPHPKSKTDP